MQFVRKAFTAFAVRPSVATAARDEQASSLIECALILPILVLLLVGAVDFGRAWYLNLEVAAAAEAGSLYGIQNSNDIAGMKAAATLDAPDLPALQSSATYGNECSDGSSAVPLGASVPNCTFNAVAYVEVSTSAVYKPLFNYPGLPSPFTLSSRSRMRTSNQ